MDPTLASLAPLAELYGVQTSYYDVSGQLRQAAPEPLLRILQTLGAPLQRPEEAADALRFKQQESCRRMIEPVVLAWDGKLNELTVRVPAKTNGAVGALLKLETGEEIVMSCPLAYLPSAGEVDVGGVTYATRRLLLPAALPLGYHRLTLEVKDQITDCLILAAPERSYQPPVDRKVGGWGVFAPLYALHAKRSWGVGDFTLLEEMADWTAELGGGMVATLPLLAAFLDEPFDPGPYSPASRLFWNELYLDVARIPELAASPAAQAMLASADFEKERTDLQSQKLVDYRRVMKFKRRVLEELSKTFFAGSSARQEAFRQFASGHAHLEDYARFRAVVDRRKESWTRWPQRLRDGVLQPGDYDENACRYHQYVQWLADEQLRALAAKARNAGSSFYLDLPLGANANSFDVWRERDAFAVGLAAGAPPDPFFAKGQNWGFPPLHPERIRAQGYRYVTSYVRHHLALASVLRIDHVMGLHRLFWIPEGMDASQGIYVKYPAEELYAVFSLESHRHQAVLVGEDLGTVPPEVPAAMTRHNMHRMYVLQYALQPWAEQALQPVFDGAAASVNTHDMPTFAAFWQGLDIDDRIQLGILEPGTAAEEHRQRQALIGALVQFLRNHGRLGQDVDCTRVLRACLAHMCQSKAFVTLVGLEDLWGELAPQNVPGTWKERPNWRRRAAFNMEAIRQMPEVLETLREVSRLVRSRP